MREKVKSILDDIQRMNKKYEFKTLEGKIENIWKDIEKFSLKILFVGGFSAGKSALINTIIGDEILEEGQRPETAIAGEIIYDTDEYIEAVNSDVTSRYTLADANKIDVKQYDFLIWHLNCEELKRYGECTIVDMPGFNSGIEEHNKAILRYVGKENAYILVIDCEDGTIKSNMMDFIDEIKNYDNNMAIVITKTDLKTNEDVERIRENISIGARTIFEDNVPIIVTSKFDDDARDKIKNLITGFDRDRIFMQEFVPQAYEIGVRCVDSMEIYKKGLKLDLSQFDEEIDRHERTKRKLVEKLKTEKGKLENRFRNSVGPSIIGDMENALYSRIDDLVNGLKGGEKSFSMMVNNILRPVLLNSTQQYVEQSFDKFMEGIVFSSSDIDMALNDIGTNVLEKYRKTNSKIQEIAKDGDKLNSIYKTFTTTMAVVTSVIAPWLELIIIFLPDILKLFGMVNQDASLRNKVNNEIIPQIVSRMQPEVENTLMEMKESMIQQAEEEMSALIDNETESLEAVKEKRKKMSNEFDEKIEEIQQDIDKINALLGEII